MRFIRTVTLIVGALFLPVLNALAQPAFPNKPVKLVVPFATGGGTDMLGRIVAERLSTVWKQPVVVENRTGVGGIIGADYVAKQKSDGYTLLLGTASTHAVAPTYRPNLPYNVERDFVAVSEVATQPMVLVVPASLPVQSLTEFVAYAKSKNGDIPYDGSQGTAPHMAMELLAARAGIKMVLPISYRGSSAALIDIVSGQLDAGFNDVPPSVTFIKEGKLRALAVTSPTRNALIPDVPTVAESGYPGYDADVWLGLFAPAGTAPEIVEKIALDLKTALSDPGTIRKLQDGGFSPVVSSPSDFSIRVRNDIQKWGKVLNDAGIKMQ